MKRILAFGPASSHITRMGVKLAMDNKIHRPEQEVIRHLVNSCPMFSNPLMTLVEIVKKLQLRD
ncbi:hypothetical protein FGIG_10184 [Fasciola gigantica]|uniref:Uncharacterized protein n=1 Tax=Fasciola gigantica TaxID=46835 RepID=A0A504YP05_FASGI|nr:hypothetical protein FGIG_10184 [Fasciola gigantica]